MAAKGSDLGTRLVVIARRRAIRTVGRLGGMVALACGVVLGAGYTGQLAAGAPSAGAAAPASHPGAATVSADAASNPLSLGNFTIVDPSGHPTVHTGPVDVVIGSDQHLLNFDAAGYRFTFVDAARALLPGEYSTSVDAWVGMANDPACIAGTTTGGFEIDQAAYGSAGQLMTFGVRFAFSCYTGASVRGTIAYELLNTTPHQGYYLFDQGGGLDGLGNVNFLPYLGTPSLLSLNAPIVGAALDPYGGGYWMAAADGGVFSYGDASFYGSMGATPLNQPIVGMAATPTGHGYWLVAADGGIFSFGDASFYGSMAGTAVQHPIAGMVVP